MNLMLRCLGIGILLATASGSAQAACRSYSDGYGNTSVRCSDGTRGFLHTDDFGHTSGHIGDQKVTTYRDGYGNTSGRVGGQRIQTHTDPYGTTTGVVGQERINGYRDASGSTRLRLGNERVRCHTNGLGHTHCR